MDPIVNKADLINLLSGKNFISNKLVPPPSNKMMELNDPVRRNVTCLVPCSSESDVDLACLVASESFNLWKDYPPRKRGALVSEIASIIEKHKENFAFLLTLETGKAIRTESRPEVGVTADIFRFYGGLGSEIKGETLPFDPANLLSFTVREPLGVVAAIVPWNVPMMIMALKVAPALVAGNTVVIKPAEEAPLSILYLAYLTAGILPPGVFNVICGDGESTGASLINHKSISKITLTGSVETGKIVAKVGAEKLVPVTLELGGKSPMIIFDDCDIDRAVEGAFSGMRFTRQGQSCSAASRIFVHENIYKDFVDKLKVRLDRLVIGDPAKEETDAGTMISVAQYNRVKGYLNSIKGSQIRATYCSNLPSDKSLSDGLFLQPVLLEDVPFDAPVACQEIFGPVTCLFKFNDTDDIVKVANNTEFGLAGTVWSNNIQKALGTVLKLNAGFVQINQNMVVQAGLSYGGFKNSGLGKEASLEAMLEHYTRKKTVLVALSS